MEWTQLIIAVVTALIPTGGIVAIFTLREKKTDMMLDNANKINAQWATFAEKEEERRRELKEDLDRKDAKIDRLYEEIGTLRKELDTEHSERVRSDLLNCDKLGCLKRRPPFGQGGAYTYRRDTETYNDEDNTNENGGNI